MKFIKWFYDNLGNTKAQRFRRLILLLALIGFIITAVFNVGYDKNKGVYWKPLDVSINKNIK
jgi:hypothetical protein